MIDQQIKNDMITALETVIEEVKSDQIKSIGIVAVNFDDTAKDAFLTCGGKQLAFLGALRLFDARVFRTITDYAVETPALAELDATTAPRN